MKVPQFVLALIVIAACLAALVPALSAYTMVCVVAALLAGLVLAVLALPTSGGEAKSTSKPVVEAARPADISPAAPAPRAEAEIVAFLALLQEKGRLVDFLMDDITGYQDAQVGAAARVVHQGCRAVLQEHFKLQPVQASAEGGPVTIAAGFTPGEYRFVGKAASAEAAPVQGTLLHKGWKTAEVKLPRLLAPGDGARLPVVAPAEIEVK